MGYYATGVGGAVGVASAAVAVAPAPNSRGGLVIGDTTTITIAVDVVSAFIAASSDLAAATCCPLSRLSRSLLHT